MSSTHSTIWARLHLYTTYIGIFESLKFLRTIWFVPGHRSLPDQQLHYQRLRPSSGASTSLPKTQTIRFLPDHPLHYHRFRPLGLFRIIRSLPDHQLHYHRFRPSGSFRTIRFLPDRPLPYQRPRPSGFCRTSSLFPDHQLRCSRPARASPFDTTWLHLHIIQLSFTSSKFLTRLHLYITRCFDLFQEGSPSETITIRNNHLKSHQPSPTAFTMADNKAGSSNPTRGLVAHLDQNRSLQQDRVVGSSSNAPAGSVSSSGLLLPPCSSCSPLGYFAPALFILLPPCSSCSHLGHLALALFILLPHGSFCSSLIHVAPAFF